MTEDDIRNNAERELAVLRQKIEVLIADPWFGDGNWGAMHHTGLSRRGGLRGGYFVAVSDLRTALEESKGV